jgi:hypothetical protein
VGVPTWQPNGTLAAKPATKRICENTTISVPAELGPMTPAGCGAMRVVHVASLQPLAVAVLPLVGATPMAVDVTGCPQAAMAPPVITASRPKAEVQEVYGWTAKLTSDGGKGITVTPGKPVKVTFVAATQRSPVRRSVTLTGTVTVEASTDKAIKLDSATVGRAKGGREGRGRGRRRWDQRRGKGSGAPAASTRPGLPGGRLTRAGCLALGGPAPRPSEPVRTPPPSLPPETHASPPPQVAVYDGRDKYISAPLNCSTAGAKSGAAPAPGGPLSLHGRGAPVTCSYSVPGVQVGNGAVLPVLIPSGGAGPLPADPIVFSVGNATKNIVGDCADLGSAMMMMQAKKRAPWQPAFVGQALTSGSDCEGGNTQRFSLWFGGNAQGTPSSPPPACGDYTFGGTLTLLPTNGDPVVSEVRFPVRVPCSRRRRALLWDALAAFDRR